MRTILYITAVALMLPACTPFSEKKAEIERNALGYRQASQRACHDIQRRIEGIEPYRSDMRSQYQTYVSVVEERLLPLCTRQWMPTDIESASELFEASFDLMKIEKVVKDKFGPR